MYVTGQSKNWPIFIEFCNFKCVLTKQKTCEILTNAVHKSCNQTD